MLLQLKTILSQHYAATLGKDAADLLRLTGAEVETIERCSAVDGTWGDEQGVLRAVDETGRPLFKDVRESGATRVATDCPLAALQITQGTGMEARHPIRIPAEAYGMDLE